MPQMTFETIVCRWCHKDTPESGSYCMHCSRNPKPLRSMLWPGEKLEVADGADFGPLMEAVFGKKKEEVPSAEAVRWALSRLREKWAQVLIRLYGLDGKDGRTVPEIFREVNAREVRITDTTIYNSRNRGLHELRWPTVTLVLLGLRPVSE